MIPFFRPLLLAGAGVLGAIYLISANQAGSIPFQPKPCTFEVTADSLNVRSGPTVGANRVDSLKHGEEVTATSNVVNGFRALSDTRWAAAAFLAPTPGSACSP